MTEPDPRMAIVDYYFEGVYDDRGQLADFLTNMDAADRVAGVIRVRTDDATVEKVARAIRAVSPSDLSVPFEGLTSNSRGYWLDRARAVLEALTTS